MVKTDFTEWSVGSITYSIQRQNNAAAEAGILLLEVRPESPLRPPRVWQRPSSADPTIKLVMFRVREVNRELHVMTSTFLDWVAYQLSSHGLPAPPRPTNTWKTFGLEQHNVVHVLRLQHSREESLSVTGSHSVHEIIFQDFSRHFQLLQSCYYTIHIQEEQLLLPSVAMCSLWLWLIYKEFLTC